MGAHFYIDDAPTEKFRRLPHRLTLEMDKADDHTIFGRELRQRRMQELRRVPLPHEILKTLPGFRCQEPVGRLLMFIPEAAQRHLLAGGGRAPGIVTTSQRDPGQPMRERHAKRKGAQRGIGPDKGVMRHLFDHVVSNMARHDATDMLLVARYQFHKEIHLSGQDPADDLFIRRSVRRSGARLTQKESPMPKSEDECRRLHVFCNLTGPSSDLHSCRGAL